MRIECSSKGSHVEMRACLQTKANDSLNELRKAEDDMRKALAGWNQDTEDIRQSISRFDTSVKQFNLFRKLQCEFIASLAAGGNGQGDLRLSCIYELNENRITQIEQTKALLK